MALTQRLDLRQTQALVMTPQLQQAIKLLQLSSLDLNAYVEQELERNPLLRREGTEAEAAAGDEAPERVEALAAPKGAERDLGRLGTDGTLPERGQEPLDADYDQIYDEAPYERAESGGGSEEGWSGGDSGLAAAGWTSAEATRRPGGGDEVPGLEQRLVAEEGLRASLVRQVFLALDDPAERALAEQLIDLLDPAGYLRDPPGALAEQLGCEEARVRRLLSVLKTLEPAGLFAADLSECLALQLADRGRLGEPMRRLLGNLDLLAARDLARLQKAVGLEGEALGRLIAELRSLDPKPAARFLESPAAPVVPDILLMPDPAGGWRLELNPQTLPRVLVDRDYHARINRSLRDREARTFVSEQLQSARWLVKALDQRATTILKVATAIVAHQDAFFRLGVQHLKPLTLRAVAERIEMHESTVSRVTANKFLASPRGVFELRYFFSAAIQAADGEAQAAEAVRYRIRALIEAERPDDVLSDDRIVEVLRRDGLDIARRTVAKYREALRIPSSVQRRREKRMALP